MKSWFFCLFLPLLRQSEEAAEGQKESADEETEKEAGAVSQTEPLVVYLNDLISSVKGTANKISEDSNNISDIVDKINDYCNNNEIEQNENSKLVNNVNKNLKSLLEESKELQKIIKYFKLKE